MNVQYAQQSAGIKLPDGTHVEYVNQVGNAVLYHFSNILGSFPDNVDIELSDSGPNMISEEGNEMLCEVPSLEDVKEAIFHSIQKASLACDGCYSPS